VKEEEEEEEEVLDPMIPNPGFVETS